MKTAFKYNTIEQTEAMIMSDRILTTKNPKTKLWTDRFKKFILQTMDSENTILFIKTRQRDIFMVLNIQYKIKQLEKQLEKQ